MRVRGIDRQARFTARTWEFNARTDPLWSILADPRWRGGRWDTEEFFRTGEQTVVALWEKLERLGYLPRRRRALDFGCGVGRLTQPLGTRFKEVVGVDVSPTMIEQARLFNQQGNRVQYVVNDAPSLRCFRDGEFSAAFSLIVLQHMPPKLALSYLNELLRVVEPRGILIFQLVTRRRVELVSPVRRAAEATRSISRDFGGVSLRRLFRRGGPIVRMYGFPREVVQKFLSQAATADHHVEAHPAAGREWESFLYIVRKGH